LRGINTETGKDTKFGGLFPQGINFVGLELGPQMGIKVTLSSAPGTKDESKE
jgi:hypothetical protein